MVVSMLFGDVGGFQIWELVTNKNFLGLFGRNGFAKAEGIFKQGLGFGIGESGSDQRAELVDIAPCSKVSFSIPCPLKSHTPQIPQSSLFLKHFLASADPISLDDFLLQIPPVCRFGKFPKESIS